MIKRKILIATGGTGGHIFPAYSLANYFIKKNYKVELTTDVRGLNYLKDRKNINLKKIFSSPLKNDNIFILLFSLIKICISVIMSFLFLLINRPSIVIGMGGYSSFPVCVAASILRIKLVIYENNLIIGKTNKYLLPFVNKIFVSYKELEGIAKVYEDKIFKVGNIIREEMINKKTLNNDFSNFDNAKILVLGGSQGARVFAEELPKVFEKINKSKLPIKVYQQCQKQQNDQLSQFYKMSKINYEIFNFTDKIIDYYTKANLVITRSGASALGELINVKIPFISIPLPSSADDHQIKNAKFYEKRGCGYFLRENEIHDKLYNLIISIYNDKRSIKNILHNQEQHSDKDIFRNLEIEIENIINEKN